MAAVHTIVVTGAAGFIGAALARALRQRSAAQGAEVNDLITTDLTGADVCGDIADPGLIDSLFLRPVHTVFHLAGIVSGRAEADFALGKRVNLDASIALLERCRAQTERGGPAVRFVYASSIAVFGTPLPERIDDATPPLPTLSYGAHKRVIELLIDDCSRRGFIDGRALRLPGVLLRPPTGNGALSGFNSDLIREPLAGRNYVCPVGPDASLWLTSLQSTLRNLLTLADADAGALGAQRALTAPALAVRVGDIVAALGRIDPAAPARAGTSRVPALEAQFGRWPLECRFEQAAVLGLTVEPSIEALLVACTRADQA
jgi:D-erythronate 2-dehydrogenase